MQILPTNIADSLKTSVINSFAVNDERSAQFMDAMNEALENSEDDADESQSQGQAAADAEALRASQAPAPYSRHSSNGVTFTLGEVCFTKQELQELSAKLAQNGASNDALSRLNALADLPDGATLGQVMGSLKGEGTAVTLSDEDKANIASLLGQLDPSGLLANSVQDLMQEGQGRDALKMILDFASQLDPSGSLEVSRAEALSLGRGLGLGQDSLNALLRQFGEGDTLSGAFGQLAHLLAPASGYFSGQDATRQSLDKALKATLQPMLAAARARTEKERQAGALQDHEAQQSRAYIDRTVQQRSRDILEDTLARGQDDARQAAAQGLEASMAEQDAALAASSADMPGAQPDGLAAQAHQNAREGDMPQGQARQDARQNAQDDKADKGWNELLNRVEVKAAPTAARHGGPAFAGTAQAQAGSLDGQAQNARQATPLNRQVAQEITQGALSTLRDGSKRMDLQLNSQELGTVTVSLTVRNGEVSATLRSEKSETVEELQRQMDAIRTALEDQGLKVEKVDVQLQSQDEQKQLWQDLDQHNFQQEQQARREEFARLRNLITMRNSSSNNGNSQLEQPVHTGSVPAQYATGRLNMVA